MDNPYKEFLEITFPLLEKFREITPSSFKHCSAVEGICAAVGSEIDDLTSEALRCAARFHDVGKMFNPHYFIENQDGTNNPHDELDPLMSYQIITRHVSDSVLVLVQYDFPKDVIDIVSQHHGNTIVQFFFQKSGLANEEAYRYKCRPPATTEAAILMIVDAVEATARSVYQKGLMDTPESRKQVVTDTIERLSEDSQLDHLKLGVLKIIKRVITRELDALFHKRIPYPEDESSESKAKKKK